MEIHQQLSATAAGDCLFHPLTASSNEITLRRWRWIMRFLQCNQHSRVQESRSTPFQAHWSSPSPSPIGLSPPHPTSSSSPWQWPFNRLSTASVNPHQETSPPSSSPPTSSTPQSTFFIWELLTTPPLFPSTSPSTQHPPHCQMGTARLFSHWVCLLSIPHSIMILISPSPFLVEEMEHLWEEGGATICWHCCRCWFCWLFLHASSLLDWWCFLMFITSDANGEKQLLEWWRVTLCEWKRSKRGGVIVYVD